MTTRPVGRASTILVCLAASTPCAGAENFSLVSLRKIDQNALRLLREIENAPPESILAQTNAAPPERTSAALTLGFARELDQSGDQASMTPFLLGLERGNWQYQLSGAGYTWARSGDERTHGVADVSALLAYTYALSSKVALVPAFEVTRRCRPTARSARITSPRTCDSPSSTTRRRPGAGRWRG